ncbi:MAG: single-stranded DNA-binding protein [Proteobacteria bacterium]|nr:single-stranded DNA-binding protein [Pseudomonadota bacterium]
MAGSLNKVSLIGNVGKDPDIRSTQDGREVVTFSLATSESWRDKITGERREKTEWHRIVVFSPHLITIIKNHLHKGSKVYIEGSLQTRKWSDQSGIEKYTTEVVIQAYSGMLVLLTPKGDEGGAFSEQNPSFQNKNRNDYEIEEEQEDQIPF